MALMAVVGASGCVERRYTIRSDPPGALAIVNGEEIGTTPVSHSYTYYGARNIRLQREGYKTQDIVEDMKAPWYDNVATEFFTENLVPFTIRDEREYVYKMEPVEPENPAELMNRADNLRAAGQAPPPPRRKGLLGFFGF